MAGEVTEIERVAAATHSMADQMAKADKSAAGMSTSLNTLLTSYAQLKIADHIIDIVKRTEMWQNLSKAVSRENLNRVNLLKQDMHLTNEKHRLEQLIRTGSAKDAGLFRAELEQTEKQLAQLDRQKLLVTEITKFEGVRLNAMRAMIGAGTLMWFNARQFNQNLIEANSSWQHRDRLIRQTLVSQAQLGIGFDDITRSAAALVHYGMDTTDTFETNLKLVAQMEQGLGISAQHSAQLASIVERQLKGSFESVSHTIAQIVDDTALAGDEAARLAVNISTALGRLRPGLSAATLPEVVRLVGRYESALKEVGGQSGAFQQLLAQLTTPEGLVGAGALGVSPEFLATSQGVQSVMDRFAQYGKMLVGESEGWERQMRLQALAQVFNVSADQANQMLIAIKRANETQIGAISTQDRWRQQLNATNSGIQRLGNSLLGLLQGAMYPVVFLVGALANRLADLVEWLLKSKTVVYTVGIALLGGTVVLAAQMWGLVRALAAVALSSNIAQAALARQAALTVAAGGATGFAGLGGMLGRFIMPIVTGVARVFGLIATPLGLVVALLGSLVGIALRTRYWLQKGVEDNAAAQKIILHQRDKLEAQRSTRLYMSARYGEEPTEGILKQYGLRLQDIIARDDISWSEKRRQMKLAQAETEKEILTARMTRNLFTPLVERSEGERKADKELLNINERMLGVNEKQEKHMIESIKRQNAIIEEERQEKAKDRLQHRLPPQVYGPGHGMPIF